jgi:hypothetical protein
MKTVMSILFSLLLSLSYGQHGRGGGGHGNGGNGGRAGGHGNAGHGNAGRGGGYHHGGNRVVVVHRSQYRPVRMGVYHPVWGPQFAYNRRWVYFPQRNLYWDNWRNNYVFWNGAVWISQPAPPAGVIIIDLHKEPKKELKETDDDVDDIYINNEQHKTE